ncbi:MAG TPA: HisA/HisF-related TIM barrel protein [Xanthobacteraceae bacterium]|jgi:phosphoribosylformimino-5-aminoimidazole carboxamide ribotide isomerase|nr:HisA/HisF-related TIM barrel protein [Xanthobacteraceae bacterium]
MQVIPVIDLKGGRVVHARQGARHLYAPIVSPLAAGSAPRAIVAALLALAPFTTLYVADLDAIAGEGDNAPAIRDLRAAFPALALWVDAGENSAAALAARHAADAGIPVVGSETLADAQALAGMAGLDFVLSLDHDAQGPRGPQEVHATPALWPRRVIAMTLAKVGSGAGPDLERLADIRARHEAVAAPGGAIALFAAGGVRHVGDLDTLAAKGVKGALVATALHDGRLSREDLARFA